MNKKLIALAVAAGIAPIVAHAETTPYANIQFELANIESKAGGTTTKAVNVTDRERGQIGLKGSEDLGNGLSAIAKAEFDFVGGNRDSEFGNETSTSTEKGNALRVREIMAGLKGGFGEFQIGTLKSAYKYTGGVTYDPFVATTLEARGNFGMTAGDMGQNAFINNALAYKGKFGPIGAWITYSPDDTDRDADGKKDGGQYTYGVKYNAGNIEAFIAGDDAKYSLASKKYKSTKVGGKFSMGGGTAIKLQYEKGDKAGKDLITTFLGAEFGMGTNTLVAQVGTTKLDDGKDDTNDGSYMALGAIHKFSKKSRAFVGYKTKKAKDSPATEDTVLSVGLRVDI